MKTNTQPTRKGIARLIAIAAFIFIGFTSAYARGGWSYRPVVEVHPVYHPYRYIAPVCVHYAPVIYYRHGCH